MSELRYRLAKRKGFSFIEALIIIVIVGVGLIPLINLLIMSFQMNQVGHRYLQAGLAIQEILTILKNSRPELIRKALLAPKEVSLKEIDYEFNEDFKRSMPRASIVIDRYDYDDLFLISINIEWEEKSIEKHASCEYLLSLTNEKFLKVGDL